MALIRHGTQAGYDAERKTGRLCDRCRAAHRVYNKQFTKQYKAAGGRKMTAHEIIDQLDTMVSKGTIQGNSGTVTGQHTPAPVATPSGSEDSPNVASDYQTPSGPSLSDRVRGLVFPNTEQYVSDQEIPDYLHAVDPDPDPPTEDGWAEVPAEEFVINAAGMRKIEDSLGTYLSVIGMTVEMIDPYCGPIVAQNMENIVVRWSKVIAHYPKAANIFLNESGGVLMLWMGAIQSTWPVLYALYEHHLAKTVKVDDGMVMRRVAPEKAQQNGQGDFDNLTPPMQESFRYTAE